MAYSTNNMAIGTTKTAPTKPTGLLDLPLEIRLQIYEHVVGVAFGRTRHAADITEDLLTNTDLSEPSQLAKLQTLCIGIIDKLLTRYDDFVCDTDHKWPRVFSVLLRLRQRRLSRAPEKLALEHQRQNAFSNLVNTCPLICADLSRYCWFQILIVETEADEIVERCCRWIRLLYSSCGTDLHFLFELTGLCWTKKSALVLITLMEAIRALPCAKSIKSFYIYIPLRKPYQETIDIDGFDAAWLLRLGEGKCPHDFRVMVHWLVLRWGNIYELDRMVKDGWDCGGCNECGNCQVLSVLDSDPLETGYEAPRRLGTIDPLGLTTLGLV